MGASANISLVVTTESRPGAEVAQSFSPQIKTPEKTEQNLVRLLHSKKEAQFIENLNNDDFQFEVKMPKDDREEAKV